MVGASEFKASRLSELDRLRAFVKRACERTSADVDSRFALRLAVEESFTNIMQHGYGPDGGPVTVGVQTAGDDITIVIRDRGPAFDPGDTPAPDLDADWQHRRLGGLGVHLMKAMVDHVAYVRSPEGENVLTLVKRISRVATDSGQGG